MRGNDSHAGIRKLTDPVFLLPTWVQTRVAAIFFWCEESALAGFAVSDLFLNQKAAQVERCFRDKDTRMRGSFHLQVCGYERTP